MFQTTDAKLQHPLLLQIEKPPPAAQKRHEVPDPLPETKTGLPESHRKSVARRRFQLNYSGQNKRDPPNPLQDW